MFPRITPPLACLRAAFLCVAALGILSGNSARAVQVVAGATGNWSSTATWVGGVLPGVEDTVKIPTGLTVTLNADVECGGIVVEGKLTVERADRTLLCDYLLVQTAGAVFEVGTAASRFLQNFTLTLKGLSTESPMASMGAKLLGAHNGGTLNIHGRDRIEWTHLGVNAAAGATSLTLAEPVDWEVGNSIMVTSSRSNWAEAETRTITSVSPDLRTVTFTSGLGYLHNGRTITKTRSTDGKSWTGDLRAEVGLLSRNVKIQGDAVSETAGFGGHIMVMNGGATCCATAGKAFIEGVELYRMGQKSIVGRYPMHWHMVAEGGVGQYFKDSVVRHSFNRAVTIHGTESTLVENNFCYDHLGHGIFLEDGSERFNIIRKNVVLGTKRPVAGEEILDTDNNFDVVQNRSPASFWITNPNNTFTDNVAAGTEGTGYWFAFPQKPLNASLNHPRFAGLEPYKQPLGAFSGNTAHSCANGLDINDQISASDTLVQNGEWANNGPFYFDDCTWYANDVAVYAGVGGARKNVVYRNNVFSDNETNYFVATYQLCEESLMVANSGFGLLPSTTLRTVYDVYDGAGRMKNNHIVGYNASNTRFLHNTGGAIKHPNHRFEGLTFDPPNTVRSTLSDYNLIPPANIGANDPGHPRIWALVILDVDGSISGVPNSSIISNHPFMLTGGETRPLEWTNMYRSDHRFAQCRLDYNIPFGSIPNVSVVRTKTGTPTSGVYYINGYNEWHQLPLIVREDFLYTYSYESLPSTKTVDVNLDDAEVGDHYVVRFKDFGKLPGIAVTGMTSRASLAALKAGTTSGFYKETNGDFYIRPVATATQQTHTITWTSNIAMPVVDSDGDGVSDGDEAAAGTDPFRTLLGTDPFVNSDFDVAGNFENWAAFSGIGSATVAAGALTAQSTATDPQMIASNLRVSGTAVPYLLVRMKASKNGDAQFYWERLGISGFASARSVTVNYNGNNQWRVLAFPMLGNAEWQNQVITSLRFDPVNTSGTTFEIDWIHASDGNFISDVPDQTVSEDTATAALPFTLIPEIADAAFTVTGTSSNQTLIPNANIVLAGSGTSRTVTVAPAANRNGTSTITLTVSDGTMNATTTFLVTVTGVSNDRIKAATGTVLNAGTAWTGGVAPLDPDVAIWNASSGTGAFTPGSAIGWGGVAILNPAAPVTFNGTSALTLGSSGIDLSASTVNLTVNFPLVLGANQTWAVATSRVLATTGAISGTGTLTKTGVGLATLGGSNSFTGNVTISSGPLRVANSASLGTTSKTISVNNGSAGQCQLLLDGSAGAVALPAALTLNTSMATLTGAIVNEAGSNSIAGPISMVPGGGNTLITVLAGSLTLDGTITSDVATGRTLLLAGTGDNTVNGVLRDGTGAASVTVQGGAWTLSAPNTHTGSTTVTGGSLLLSGSLVGALNATGGTFAPRGTPVVASNVTVGSGASLQVRINGTTPGAQYDQLATGGNVTLGGILDLVAAPGLPASGSFLILKKTSAGAVSGSFSGRPEGSAFSVGGRTWIISYLGGDGNDVTVTLASPQQSWRFANFGTIANTGSAADTANPDGDAWTNAEEYVLGTNPMSATSSSLLNTSASGSNLTLTFTAAQASGTGYVGLTRFYDLETTTNLTNPASWTGVPGYTNIVGANQIVTVTQPLSAGPRFYRLKVRVQ